MQNSVGGGVFKFRTLYIKNTILANNMADAGRDFHDEGGMNGGGTIYDNGYNIVEHSHNYTFEAEGDITGEQTNLNLSSTLELNNTLNGTKTLKTTSGSVAINAGTSEQGGHPEPIPTTDQRGAPRNGNVDIGAYEYWDDDGSLTAVSLTSLMALSTTDEITLKWSTESELDNAGFAIYRSITKDGNYTKIGFVSAAEDSETFNDYQFTDKGVEPGNSYFYYLEDIDLAGAKNKPAIITVSIPSDKTIEVIVPPAQPVEPIPKVFRLLQNYPNPFNPETWLPYQLFDNSSVVIRIYDMKGQIIRVLDLGQKKAGYYVTKGKAAYWDGRNSFGQKVASGMYFYHLKAGDFSAGRKMVIVK